MIAWSILAAICALAVLAGALRVRAVMPAIAAAGALAVSLPAPVVALALAVVSLALLALGRLVWRLLDDE